MALTKGEFRKLRKQCDKLPDGPDYRGNNYVTNLLLTALDFHKRVETVDKALEYFRDNHRFRTHKGLKAHLRAFPDTKEGNLELANSLWNYNFWSRAKFLRILVKEFEARDVEDQKSLRKWVKSANFERDVKRKFEIKFRSPKDDTKECTHSIGFTLFSWLQLRLGVPTVKPDVHVVRFVSSTIGRKVSDREASESLRLVAKQTNREPALLDSTIWHYQRGRT